MDRGGLVAVFHHRGGHRRVWDEDIVAFLIAHKMPVPPRLQGASVVPRALVVDDEKPLRDLILLRLKAAFPELEGHEAEDGFEAGRKIAELNPALVVLDYKLPGLDGAKVCASVKKDPRLRSIKILAVTGFEPETSRDALLAAGADGFLAKPFRSEDLLKEVKRLLPWLSSKISS
jgi:CheY-like chemotaxis protein